MVDISQDIEIITVNYNTPKLYLRLYRSIRKNISKTISVRVIDGSDKPELKNSFCGLEHKNPNFKAIRLGFNIHHGCGMDFGLRTSNKKYVFIIDSDVYITKENILKYISKNFIEGAYGAGQIILVNKIGENTENKKNGLRYMHPRCMLVDREMYLEHKRFKNHGAPCLFAMKDIKEKKTKIIQLEKLNDFFKTENRGTVKRQGGYNLGPRALSINIDDEIKKYYAKENKKSN